MNYYKHNICDYLGDTAHLTVIEHGAYRKLLDYYYLNDGDIPVDTNQVYRRLCARTDEERQAVDTILVEFFFIKDRCDCNGNVTKVYGHTRCDKEILAYQSNANASKENGKLGGRPTKSTINFNETNQVISGYENETQNNLNQEPLTKIETAQPKPTARGTRLPKDWVPDSDEYMAFCKNARPDLDFLEMVDKFRDYWCSKPGRDGTKLDWLMTWRNFIRQERGFSHKATNGSSVAKLERDAI